jgi:UDP:flavonoid glycosyltransferase YjiC (YdhE family)
MPLGRDQLDNAAKVSYHGCGIRLSSKSGENRIQRAVMSLLTDHSFRHKAESFAEEIKIAEAKDLAIQSLVALTDKKRLPV